jgi:hypothetical protein
MAGESYTTSFEKMGDQGIPKSVVNMSGDRSAYTKLVGRKTEGRGASPTGTKANRGRTMINEAHGPTFRPVATLYKANAAEASATQRNTRIMKPAMGDRDFWGKRAWGQQNG